MTRTDTPRCAARISASAWRASVILYITESMRTVSAS
jgi:hypothetical protein